MSDGLPTEEQLRRMERTVMTRIRRRAELPKRIATGAAAVALLAGGVLALPRLVVAGGGTALSGGSTAEQAEDSGGGASGSRFAACRASSSARSPVRSVPIAADTVEAALEACVQAFAQGQVPAVRETPIRAGQEPVTTKDLVVCRDADGTLQVFPKDDRPSSLCRRNGMAAP